jgi:hypothetical protein
MYIIDYNRNIVREKIISEDILEPSKTGGLCQERIGNYFRPRKYETNWLMNCKLNYFTPPPFILHQFKNLFSFTPKLIKSTITLQ